MYGSDDWRCANGIARILEIFWCDFRVKNWTAWGYYPWIAGIWRKPGFIYGPRKPGFPWCSQFFFPVHIEIPHVDVLGPWLGLLARSFAVPKSAKSFSDFKASARTGAKKNWSHWSRLAQHCLFNSCNFFTSCYELEVFKIAAKFATCL